MMRMEALAGEIEKLGEIVNRLAREFKAVPHRDSKDI